MGRYRPQPTERDASPAGDHEEKEGPLAVGSDEVFAHPENRPCPRPFLGPRPVFSIADGWAELPGAVRAGCKLPCFCRIACGIFLPSLAYSLLETILGFSRFQDDKQRRRVGRIAAVDGDFTGPVRSGNRRFGRGIGSARTAIPENARGHRYGVCRRATSLAGLQEPDGRTAGAVDGVADLCGGRRHVDCGQSYLSDASQERNDHFRRPAAAHRQGTVGRIDTADRSVLSFAGPGCRAKIDCHRVIGHRERRVARHSRCARGRRPSLGTEWGDSQVRRYAAAAHWKPGSWTKNWHRRRCRRRC